MQMFNLPIFFSNSFCLLAIPLHFLFVVSLCVHGSYDISAFASIQISRVMLTPSGRIQFGNLKNISLSLSLNVIVAIRFWIFITYTHPNDKYLIAHEIEIKISKLLRVAKSAFENCQRLQASHANGHEELTHTKFHTPNAWRARSKNSKNGKGNDGAARKQAKYLTQ